MKRRCDKCKHQKKCKLEGNCGPGFYEPIKDKKRFKLKLKDHEKRIFLLERNDIKQMQERITSLENKKCNCEIIKVNNEKTAQAIVNATIQPELLYKENKIKKQTVVEWAESAGLEKEIKLDGNKEEISCSSLKPLNRNADILNKILDDSRIEIQKKNDFELPEYLKSYGDYQDYLYELCINAKDKFNNFLDVIHDKKIYATIKLQYIADQLNGDWKPDWNKRTPDKWYLGYDYKTEEFSYQFSIYYNSGHVYFKSEEIAKQAREIMGDDIYLYLLGKEK